MQPELVLNIQSCFSTSNQSAIHNEMQLRDKPHVYHLISIHEIPSKSQ